MSKRPKKGLIPCLVCGEPYEFLTTNHMGTHPPGYPQTDPDYREWVAEEWDMAPEDVPLHPNDWLEMRGGFPGWRDRIIES